MSPVTNDEIALNASIDLRQNGALCVTDAKWLLNNEGRIRADYDDLVELIIKKNSLNHLDLLLSVTCRDTNNSKVLDFMCRLALLRSNLERGSRYQQVLVNSPRECKYFKAILDEFGNFSCDVKPFDTRQGLLGTWVLNICKSFYGCLSDLIWGRVFLKKTKPNEKIVLVDTFLIENSIDSDGIYSDRYYRGHEAFMSDSDLRKRWFSPTIANVRTPKQFLNMFLNISKTETNFLILERWLSVVDYLYCFFYSIYLPWKICAPIKIDGVDITDYVCYQARKELGSFSLIKSVAKYRFIYRLAKNSVDIGRVVNWSENQSIDRALIMGIKRYYPKIIIHGYQGFIVADHYACVQPKLFEQKLGTLPDIFVVASPFGNAFRNDAPHLFDVRLAPAFRFSYLSDIIRSGTSEVVIVFALPINETEYVRLVKESIHLRAAVNPSIKIILKSHPTVTVDKIAEVLGRNDDCGIEISKDDMASLLSRASLIVSTGSSSACMEAVALGIPLIIFGNLSGITLNPIPAELSLTCYQICFTSDEITDFVNNKLNVLTLTPLLQTIFPKIVESDAKAFFTLQS